LAPSQSRSRPPAGRFRVALTESGGWAGGPGPGPTVTQAGTVSVTAPAGPPENKLDCVYYFWLPNLNHLNEPERLRLPRHCSRNHHDGGAGRAAGPGPGDRDSVTPRLPDSENGPRKLAESPAR
jgi:hypothetical protein